MAIRFGNGFGIGASNGGGSSLSFFTNIGAIASYLKGYMSDFRNPDFYSYALDGSTGHYINDGNNDMYDSGNYTTPWLISNVTYTGQSGNSNDYPYSVDYSTNGTGILNTSFGYVSLGYQNPDYLPLTVIGTRATIASAGTPIGFQCGGNSGADGQGTHVEGNIYTGDTVSGFTVHAYYSETYNAGDPSTCSVFILLGHPDWNSVFGDVYYGGDSDTNGNGAFLYTSGGGATNVLAIKTLLSKDNGVEVTFSEVNTVVDNFISRISESQISPTPTPTPTPTATLVPNTPITGGYYNAGVTLDSNYSQFGPGHSSYLLNGGGGYITLTGNTDTAFGTGDFTVEWFQFENIHNQHARIFAIGDYPSAILQVSLESGNFYLMENGGWRASPSYGYINQTWVHFAIVRINNTTTIYKDGSSIYSFADSFDLNDTSTDLHIGQESPVSDSGAYFNGAINNFRWTKGLGIYTGNFTVPTGPLSFTAGANPFGGSNTSAIGDGFVKYLLNGESAPTPTPSATSDVTPTPTPSATSDVTPTPTPTPTPSTGANAGVGSWYFYSDEGNINAQPPTANGNAIFTIQGSPVVETFNPNKSSGVTFLYFNVRDSVGTNYTSQFSGYTGGTGTITISQNGDTATYTSTTPGSFFIETNLGGSPFFVIAANPCTQTKSSNASFVYADPISITFGS